MLSRFTHRTEKPSRVSPSRGFVAEVFRRHRPEVGRARRDRLTAWYSLVRSVSELTVRPLPSGRRRTPLGGELAMRTGRRELIRDLNRTLVLNLVRERGALSRADLARVTGLSPSTVTAITAVPARRTASCSRTTSRRPRRREPAASGGPRRCSGSTRARASWSGIKLAPDNADRRRSPTSMRHRWRWSSRSHAARGRPDAVADLFDDRGPRGAWMPLAFGATRCSGSASASRASSIRRPARSSTRRSPSWARVSTWSGSSRTASACPCSLDNDVNTLTVAEQLFGAGRGLAPPSSS